MSLLEIIDVNSENLDDFINLCIPLERREDPLFIKGIDLKRKYTSEAIEKYGSIGKIAYLNSKPVGLIQYLPKIEDKIIEITCIFVPERENTRKGIGKKLLEALIKENFSPKSYFNNEIPLAFIINTFDIEGRYSQREFFKKMGFCEVEKNNPYFLYYPLKKGYIYLPKIMEYTAQKEDLGKALIFMDPFCPFSIYFSEKIKESIKEIDPNIPIRIINQFEEQEEIKKRGKISFCIVNSKPIQTFFLDKDNFKKEIKKALGL
ncbi:MAG: hypothetical protein QXI49_07000 [Candidatus Methanomethylicaceae archaeon]